MGRGSKGIKTKQEGRTGKNNTNIDEVKRLINELIDREKQPLGHWSEALESADRIHRVEELTGVSVNFNRDEGKLVVRPYSKNLSKEVRDLIKELNGQSYK